MHDSDLPNVLMRASQIVSKTTRIETVCALTIRSSPLAASLGPNAATDSVLLGVFLLYNLLLEQPMGSAAENIRARGGSPANWREYDAFEDNP